MRLAAQTMAVLCLLATSMPVAAADGGRITVGRAATVIDDPITLADVATLDGEAESFGSVVLGPAPGPGGSRKIDGRTILRRLREAGFDGQRTRYVIPPSVRVQRAAQEVPSDEIERAVEIAAPNLLGPGERLRSLEVVHPVRIPLGAYRLEVASVPGTRRGSQRRFDVEVWIGERLVATGTVQARIDAIGPVVVARRPIARGAILTASDVEIEERDLGAASGQVLTSLDQAVGLQTRVPLTVGTALSHRAVENPLLVKRGDLVTVIVETPGMRLSVPGEAREHGAAGESIRVVNRKSQHELSGRVVERGVVLVHY